MIKCDIKFGYTCDNDCVHCVIADDRRALEESGYPIDLSTSEWREILDTYKSVGADYIVLTGGEVALRPDFDGIVARCRELGFFIGVQTNGRAFARREPCLAVENVERIYFTVAIHGSTPATHDAITRIRGSFAETAAGLRNLRRMGKGVTAKVVISNFNRTDLLPILEVVGRLGVDQANFTFPHALGNARLNFGEVVPRYGDIRGDLGRLVERGREIGVGIEFEAIPFCIVPDNPECVTEIYDLDRDHRLFKPVASTTLDWNEIRPTIKRKGARCEECLYTRFCEGCWSEYADRFGEGEFEPVREITDATSRLIAAVAGITSGRDRQETAPGGRV